MAGHPLIIAHRGASASAPENSMAAFALAVAQDADGVEFDVRRTEDEVLVVHHDAVVGDLGPIVATPFDVLRRQAPWIPTIDEVFHVTGDLLLDLEIKNDPTQPDHDPDQGVAQRVAAWVVENRLHRRAVVTSFDCGAIAAVRSQDPTVATGLLVAPFGAVDDAIAFAEGEGHRWVLPHHSALTDDPDAIIGTAHRRRIALVAW
ncbi:MAG: glycerophosphodiester phosphodiesterase, partial [Actinomycetota bacterium]|nr:glycerophosphodiester phosphodiesterase [Actinomycetota bacterium]